MEPRRKFPLLRWILLTTVLIGGIGGAIAAIRFARPAVIVTELVEGEAVQAFYATGTLEPADREHPIRAAMTGYIRPPDATGKYLDKGERVHKGQLLALIFNDEMAFLYDKASADLIEKRARANRENSPVFQELDANISAYIELTKAAEREFKRYSAGIEAGAANQADFDRSLDQFQNYRSKLESFKAMKIQTQLKLDRELAESESAMKVAQWNVDLSKVFSPIDGFALDKPQQIGAKVAVNDLIVTLANTTPANLVMRAQVDEEDVTKVWQASEPLPIADNWLTSLLHLPRMLAAATGSPQVVRMSLYAFADVDFSGQVARIYPKADPERRTFEVDVRLDHPSPRMQAGMTGELAFEMKRRLKTWVAPSQALQDGKIWVVRDGKLRATKAEVGIRGIERVEVVAGLQAGDRVVISPIAGLTDGQSVRIGQEISPLDAAAVNKPKKKELFRGF